MPDKIYNLLTIWLVVFRYPTIGMPDKIEEIKQCAKLEFRYPTIGMPDKMQSESGKSKIITGVYDKSAMYTLQTKQIGYYSLAKLDIPNEKVTLSIMKPRVNQNLEESPQNQTQTTDYRLPITSYRLPLTDLTMYL